MPLPSFFATSLAKALVGEQPCLLQPWLNGRKMLPKREQTASLAIWKANHTLLLHAEADRLRAEGWRVTMEQFFRLEGTTAILTGKPDLIAQMDGKRPKILDVKSGEAQDYYAAQVMVYQIAIPLAWDRDWSFDGEVVYGTGERVTITPYEAATLKPKLFALLRQLGNNQRPEASPSESSCRWCEATKEICPVRVEETTAVTTNEF